MTKDQLRKEMNQMLGNFLKTARIQKQKSLDQVASALGKSENEVKHIEEFPAQIPGTDLYELIEFYGPDVARKAEWVLLDLSLMSYDFRRKKSRTISPLISKESVYGWLRSAIAFLSGFLLWNIIKRIFGIRI